MNMLSAESSKVCGYCKQEKPLSAFQRNRGSRDGLTRWCRECKNFYERERLRDHPRGVRKRKEAGKNLLRLGAGMRIHAGQATPIDGSAPAPAPAPAPGHTITLREWLRSNGQQMRAFVVVKGSDVRLMVEQLPDASTRSCVYRVWFRERERRSMTGSADVIEQVLDYVLPELLECSGAVLFPGVKTGDRHA